jgi:hypothetical protein
MYVGRTKKKRAKDKTNEQPFLKIQEGEKEQQYATKRQRENHLTNFWKEPKSMYVCRQTNTNKTKSQNKLAAVPENSRAGGEGTWRSSGTMQQEEEEGESQRENHLTNFFFSPSKVWRLITGPLESWNMFRSSTLSSALLDDDDDDDDDDAARHSLSPPPRRHPSFFQNHF